VKDCSLDLLGEAIPFLIGHYSCRHSEFTALALGGTSASGWTGDARGGRRVRAVQVIRHRGEECGRRRSRGYRQGIGVRGV